MLSVRAGVLSLTGVQVHSHPVVVRVFLRSRGSLNRSQLRGTNRTLRKTLIRISVVLIALIGLLLFSQVVRADTQTVGHGRIRLNQTRGLTIGVVQTVLNDACNRHVVLRLSLKLHDGGDGQHLEGLLVAAHAGFLQVSLGLINHGLNDLLDVGVLREAVLTRVQPTLNRGEVARHTVLGVVADRVLNLLAGERAIGARNNQVDGLAHALTLRNRQVQYVAVRINNGRNRARAAHVLLQFIGARLQVLTLALLGVHLKELISISNHARCLKLLRHLRGGLARTNRESHGRTIAATRVVTSLERVIASNQGARNDDQSHDKQGNCAQHDGAAAALTRTQRSHRHDFLFHRDAGDALTFILGCRPKEVEPALFGLFILFGH